MKNKRIALISVAVVLVIVAVVSTVWATNRTEQLRKAELTTEEKVVATVEQTTEKVTEKETEKVTEEVTEVESATQVETTEEKATESQVAPVETQKETNAPETTKAVKTTESTTEAKKTDNTASKTKKETKTTTEPVTKKITEPKKEPKKETTTNAPKKQSKLTYAEAQRVQKAANDYMASCGLIVDSSLNRNNSCWCDNCYICDNPDFGWGEYNYNNEVNYCKNAIYGELFENVCGTNPGYKRGYAYLENADEIGGYNITFCYRYT